MLKKIELVLFYSLTSASMLGMEHHGAQQNYKAQSHNKLAYAIEHCVARNLSMPKKDFVRTLEELFAHSAVQEQTKQSDKENMNPQPITQNTTGSATSPRGLRAALEKAKEFRAIIQGQIPVSAEQAEQIKRGRTSPLASHDMPKAGTTDSSGQ